jgi:hypothetical protein
LAFGTLDALHLVTMDFICDGGESVRLASCDNRPIAATQALGFTLAVL